MQTHVKRPIMFVIIAMMFSLLVAGISQAATAKTKVKSDKPHARITAKQAEAIVLKEFPGKIVEKTKLENEEGVWQYGVMVKSGKTLREVMVNAKTGKIDSVEVTNAVKEKDEAKADAAKEKSKLGGQKSDTRNK